MAINQFITQEVDHVHNIKMLLFFTDLGIEKDMEEHISQLLGQLMFFTFKDGIAKFVHLLKGLWSEGLVCLLAVPRTFFSQFIQYIQDSTECLQFFFSSMHTLSIASH